MWVISKLKEHIDAKHVFPSPVSFCLLGGVVSFCLVGGGGGVQKQREMNEIAVYTSYEAQIPA